jgi:hypothetical protein
LIAILNLIVLPLPVSVGCFISLATETLCFIPDRTLHLTSHANKGKHGFKQVKKSGLKQKAAAIFSIGFSITIFNFRYYKTTVF